MESASEHKDKAHRKALFDVSLSCSTEEYEHYKTDFCNRKVILDRNFNFIAFTDLHPEQLFQAMEWTPSASSRACLPHSG